MQITQIKNINDVKIAMRTPEFYSNNFASNLKKCIIFAPRIN